MCGRGTQTRLCRAVATNNLQNLSATQGSFAHIKEVYRERAIYVSAPLIGGGECTWPENVYVGTPGSGLDGKLLKLDGRELSPVTSAFSTLEQATEWMRDNVCSDGGEGSMRVPLRVPKKPYTVVNGVSYKFAYTVGASLSSRDTGVHFDFACPYGSQPLACPNRTLDAAQENQDELDQPTGPEFSICHEPGVADYECCRAEHAFRIMGKTDPLTTRSDPPSVVGVDDAAFCRYPSCSDDATCGENCPTHFTSYYNTSTGCEAYCNAAFQREGHDGTCAPVNPECANHLPYDAPSGADRFPNQYLTVNTWCVCGAKLPELVQPGKYVNEGTILQSLGDARARARRALDWRWDDPIPRGIDPFHNAHFDVPDACLESIMAFKTNFIPNGSSCSDYMERAAPPTTIWDPAGDYSGDLRLCASDATDDGCCVAPRGMAAMSRVWLQVRPMDDRSVADAFAASRVVGTAVHQSEVAAVGNFVRTDFEPYV